VGDVIAVSGASAAGDSAALAAMSALVRGGAAALIVGRAVLSGVDCGETVGILKIAPGARVMALRSLPALPQAGRLTPDKSGSSRDRTRTYNLPVNSRTLCRLSYAGSCACDNLDQGTSLPRAQG
jgi:hypothetical protein